MMPAWMLQISYVTQWDEEHGALFALACFRPTKVSKLTAFPPIFGVSLLTHPVANLQLNLAIPRFDCAPSGQRFHPERRAEHRFRSP